MKKLLLACVFLSSLLVSAQTAPLASVKTGTVTGKVMDKTLQQPVAYAAIVITSKADNATVTGGDYKRRWNF